MEEQTLCANAKATIDFAATTLKKAEQIAQQNTFSLLTLEDQLITRDLARQWFRLRKTQELAKLKAEVVASNVPAPPPVGVCSSHSNKTLLCDQQTPSSISLAPAPAPAPKQHQGLGLADLNVGVVDVVNDDDCAELDCDDESIGVFGNR